MSTSGFDLAPFRNPVILLLAALVAMILWLWIRHVLPFTLGRKPFLRGNYDQALRRLAFLERLHLTSAALLHLKGSVLMFAGRNQEAEKVLRESLGQVQSPEEKSVTMVNLGYVLLDERRYDEAAKALDGAIAARPKGAVAYSTRAEVYLRQGIEPQKALELLDKGIEYKQTSDMQSRVDRHIFGYLFANRAWALLLLGHPAEAEDALDEARKYSTDECKPGAAGIHYRIARVLLAEKRVPEAVEEFRRACAIDPKGKYAAFSEAALREYGA